MNTNKTAILIFANSAAKEVERKEFLSTEIFSALNKQTLKKAKKSKLPYFVVSEKEQIGISFGERFTNAIDLIFKKGFDNVIYSGVTTLWVSNTVNEIIKNYPDLNGIYNISSPPISKYELITKINTYFKLNIEIERDSSYYSNKSLNSDRFFSETKFKKPNWNEMLSDLYLDCEKNKNLYNLK